MDGLNTGQVDTAVVTVRQPGNDQVNPHDNDSLLSLRSMYTFQYSVFKLVDDTGMKSAMLPTLFIIITIRTTQCKFLMRENINECH